MHADYIQIYGSKIRDILMALKTEYTHESRPLDVVVAAGEIDISMVTVDEVIKDVKELKKWVMDKNPDNTCAFVGVNMPPHDKNGLPQTTLMRRRCYDMNSKFMELNIPLMAPQCGAWGARHSTN